MRKKGICIKVYLKPERFAEIALLAEQSGQRRGGLLLYTQKKNGLDSEKLANTDGIARYFKFCSDFYKGNKETIAAEKARLDQQVAELLAKKAKLEGK